MESGLVPGGFQTGIVLPIWEAYSARMHNTNIRHEVAQRIRLVAGLRGRSQISLATETGIANTSLGRKLAGGAEFTVSEIAAIAEALDVPGAELLPPALNRGDDDDGSR